MGKPSQLLYVNPEKLGIKLDNDVREKLDMGNVMYICSPDASHHKSILQHGRHSCSLSRKAC